ncbi:MAG TPA: hypothetical protein VF021_11005, partial [Longimicrobiales bacterium]
ILAIVAMPLLANAAHAQKWDAPLFFGPNPMDELGLYFVKTNEQNLNNPNPTGLKLIWRQTGNINLGVQVGTGDLENIGDAIMVGAEFYNPLRLGAASGLAMNWSLGAGATFGKHYADLSVPLGVSVGLNLGSGSTSLTPFAHPRISFDMATFDNPFTGREETVTDFGLAVDLGAELNLGKSLLIRGAYTIGNNNDTGKRDAFGVGAAFRMPRKVVARGR